MRIFFKLISKVRRGLVVASLFAVPAVYAEDAKTTFFGFPLGGQWSTERCHNVPLQSCWDKGEIAVHGKVMDRTLYRKDFAIQPDKVPKWVDGTIATKLYMLDDRRILAMEFELPWTTDLDSPELRSKLETAHKMIADRFGKEDKQVQHPAPKNRFVPHHYAALWNQEWGTIRYDTRAPGFYPKAKITVVSKEFNVLMANDQAKQQQTLKETDAKRLKF
ncbi:hypothetical protein RY831_29465 [Noviherbaspirillum sp. CPCC 100848]|uniref:Uncharacterized protein n=1 Tax=Noviherbaspirillum album TaxID=3080276 RepID=A0ABU6JHY6_9BURK|nr:hypothetical protein [Noviherbaspirillum sp. CPCC 100848]MEC4723290.1 hypothetical protein [Noviherbaspirillum sp. CPCC 100848]